jgi:hypothetical protein
LARDKIDYWAYCHGIREPTTEAMLAGRDRHAAYLKKFKTIDELGIEEFQYRLVSGEEITLQEIKVCSKYWGLHGIIDLLKIQMIDNNLFIKVIDLKSNWWKKYLYQLSVYAMMIQEPDAEFCYQVPYKRKKGFRILGSRIYPKNLNVNKNILTSIYLLHTGKELNFPWMTNNTLSDFASGMEFQVCRRLREYRPLHKRAFILPEDINLSRRDRQRFFGKSNLMVKTKPHIYQDPVYHV